jgi:cellulose synthase operon protein C
VVRCKAVSLESPRIAELRRRVQADPSSIAFAQLAEEHLRTADYDEAIRVCRAGLQHHPGYLSARVTLARALMEIGQFDDAEGEFDLVLETAPDNLAAIRGVAEINQRRGDLPMALGYYQAALGLARHDPDLDETVAQISRALADAAGDKARGPSLEPARSELLSGAHRTPLPVSETTDVAATSSPAVAKTSAQQPVAIDDSAAPATSPSPEVASPFNFDELLEALGQPASTPAPPNVEVWLSGTPPVADTVARKGPSVSEDFISPISTIDSPASDILAQIEQDLRRLEAEPSLVSGAPVEPLAAQPKPTEQAALDELERWLAVLEERRGSSSAA